MTTSAQPDVGVSLWLKLPPWHMAKRFPPGSSFLTLDIAVPPGATPEQIAAATLNSLRKFEAARAAQEQS